MIKYCANVTRQTAFHASFTNATAADTAVLQVSRGTSIVSYASHSAQTIMLNSIDTALGIHPISSFPVEVSCVYVREYPATFDR